MLAGARVADMPAWASRLIPDGDDLRADPSAAPVVLVDGHYLIFRSFHGMPSLTLADGTPVGALVGFCNAMNKLVSYVNMVHRYAIGLRSSSRCYHMI